MRILGIETSCDETAAAVVEDGVRVLGSAVSTQHELHRRFGGVVPEIACRAHIEHVLPVVAAAVEESGAGLEELDGVAVTTTPGLIGALLIGVTAAKALSWALELPLLAANHLHEHIYAAWLSDRAPALPAVSLVVSGGHTSLFLTEGPLEHLPLGGTVDDAAGEAFDKVANILRLPLPRRAVHRPGRRRRQPARRRLPPELARAGQRRLQLQRPQDGRPLPLPGHQPDPRRHRGASYEPQFVADVAASFQEAVVDVLAGKAFRAVERHGAAGLIVGRRRGGNSPPARAPGAGGRRARRRAPPCAARALHG